MYDARRYWFGMNRSSCPVLPTLKTTKLLMFRQILWRSFYCHTNQFIDKVKKPSHNNQLLYSLFPAHILSRNSEIYWLTICHTLFCAGSTENVCTTIGAVSLWHHLPVAAPYQEPGYRKNHLQARGCLSGTDSNIQDSMQFGRYDTCRKTFHQWCLTW